MDLVHSQNQVELAKPAPFLHFGKHGSDSNLSPELGERESVSSWDYPGRPHG